MMTPVRRFVYAWNHLRIIPEKQREGNRSASGYGNEIHI